MLGHSNSEYIDNSLLVADTCVESEENIKNMVNLMMDQGLIIHGKKSVLITTRKINFLVNSIQIK